MPRTILSPEALQRARALRDLTDPAQGPHAMQLLVEAAVTALQRAWGCLVLEERADPVVSVADNYDRLLYPPGGAARDARYTRYVAPDRLLRTQTSALIPPLLRRLAAGPPADLLLCCPGLVWRRDRIDRLHVGEPHQLDLWRLRRGEPLGSTELAGMIEAVIGALLPGRRLKTVNTVHPYTAGGLEVHVELDGAWVEVAECGLAHPRILQEAGLPADCTGLAMGIGLDRLLMLVKGLDDLRLLRSSDPRVTSQLLDLSPWRPVSNQPPIRRDLSLAVHDQLKAEELGDRVREALGDRADDVEAVEVRSETTYAALQEPARDRIGLSPGQKNVLVRLTLRALARTLTDAEANRLRDEVYAALQEGYRAEWCGDGPPGARPLAALPAPVTAPAPSAPPARLAG
jgi:phenylalanyl-tRNA synthetase alpha chain